MRILIVEDEAKVRSFITKALQQDGHDTESVATLGEMTDLLKSETFDILVLDRLLGEEDSLASLGQIRNLSPQIKILVLSALGDLEERVSGLSLGADDYLPKPFHVSELLARVVALSRRIDPEKSLTKKIEKFGLVVLLDRQSAQFEGKSLTLTGKELRLLILFLEHPEKVFSRMELLERIWGFNFDPESNVVEVTIRRLRTKLNEVGTPELIHTRRGSGYWFGSETA